MTCAMWRRIRDISFFQRAVFFPQHPAFSNYVMNELPGRLARHPLLADKPELALQETFEKVDKALALAATEDEHIYR